MKTAIVTGGTGCVGRNLIEELLRDGWRVIALHRRSSQVSRWNGLPVERVEVDMSRYESVRRSIPERADAIFHAAANVSHWPVDKAQQWRDNVLATRHLVRAALEKKVRRFIFTSTGATSLYAQLSRSEAEGIWSQYVRTKRLAELEIQDGMANGLDAVIMLPPIVVGPYDYNNYSQIFTLLEKGRLPGVLPGTIEFGHARDIARAHISAFEKGRTGERYCLYGHPATWLEFGQRVARVLHVPAPKRATPLWLLFALSYPLLWFSYITRKRPVLTPQLARLLKTGGRTPPAEIEKTKRELGYHPSSLDQMIADCHRWMIKEGRLKNPSPQVQMDRREGPSSSLQTDNPRTAFVHKE